MAKYKQCIKCPRVFEKPHKYLSICPKCRADLNSRKVKGPDETARQR